MGAIRDFLDSVGRTKTPYTGSPIPGPPPADTASTQSVSGAGTARPIISGSVLDTIRNVASNTAPTTTSAPTNDRAAFDESVRKYQLDRRAYEQYNTELNNRLRNFNPYADSQYRVASTTPPSGATSVSVPTAPAPTPPTQLRAPTYGAISQFSNLTPQQQGELYLQQRNIGYTDADIRKATGAQVGTPSEDMMAGLYKTAYPQYTQAIENQYGTQFNRAGYGTGANQIDYPGYNYYINQLSTGAVTPDTLESAIRGGAATTPTPTPVTTPGTTAPTSDINSLYQQYFNRPADAGGLQYWQQSGLTGDALRNAVIGGAQGPDLDYYNSVYNRPFDPGHFAARGGYISKYAEGGRVRTHYQTGGETELYVPSLRRSPAASPVMSITDPGYLDQVLSRPVGAEPPAGFSILDPNMGYGQMYPPTSPRSPAALDPNIDYGQMYPSTSPRSPAALALMPIEGVGEGAEITGETPRRLEGLLPVEGTGEGMPIIAAVPAVEPSAAGAPAAGSSLQDMLARYMRPSTSGGSELADARRRYQSESDAFYGLIRQMAERGESPTSRSEMYFRLAAAFGSPTRTGSMGETLSKVGEQMGEYTKGRRADESERRNLLVQAQQARMAGAREDLTTTRALAAQESTERRTLNTALLQEYIRSGQPQSNAGRMARDAGLTPGTQAFQDFVARHAELDVQRAQQLIQAQNENLTLRREAADRLSATEIKLADETSQNISSARDNALLLREAMRLNPNASPSNLTEGVITDLRRRLGSTDPVVVNTADIRNILNRLTLGSLKETFPGSISNDERIALAAVSGVTAASREERARIMQRASDALERVIERDQEHLRKIRSGAFGRVDRTQGGTQ